MDEDERGRVVKEARINALRDVMTAFARLADENSGLDEGARKLLWRIQDQIGRQVTEVTQDKAGRVEVDHTVWGVSGG